MKEFLSAACAVFAVPFRLFASRRETELHLQYIRERVEETRADVREIKGLLFDHITRGNQ